MVVSYPPAIPQDLGEAQAEAASLLASQTAASPGQATAPPAPNPGGGLSVLELLLLNFLGVSDSSGVSLSICTLQAAEQAQQAAATNWGRVGLQVAPPPGVQVYWGPNRMAHAALAQNPGMPVPASGGDIFDARYKGDVWLVGDATLNYPVDIRVVEFTAAALARALNRLQGGAPAPPPGGQSVSSQPVQPAPAPSQAPPPMTSAPLSVVAPPAPSAPAARTYTVVHGDTLWGIAEHFYGDGADWPTIYNANKGVIGGNPDLIFPGQVLTIPAL